MMVVGEERDNPSMGCVPVVGENMVDTPFLVAAFAGNNN